MSQEEQEQQQQEQPAQAENNTTGLNLVLQSVEGGQQGQFSGLATLSRMLDGSGSPNSSSSSAPASVSANNNSNNNENTSEEQQQQQPQSQSENQQQQQQQQEERGEEGNDAPPPGWSQRSPNGSSTYNSASENQNNNEESNQKEEGEQKEEGQEQGGMGVDPNEDPNEKALHEAMAGTGSFETGHFVFKHERVATGEGLYRVFDFCNKTNPTVAVLVPQIAPHLSSTYQEKLFEEQELDREGGGGSARNNNRRRRKQQKLRVGGPSPSSPSSSSSQQHQQGGGGNKSGLSAQDQEDKKTDVPYLCYSARGLGNKQKTQQQIEQDKLYEDHISSSGRGRQNQQQQQHQQQQKKGINALLQHEDFRGLHCLFDACKEAIEAAPRRFPRLRVAGVSREIKQDGNDAKANKKGASKGGATTTATSPFSTASPEASSSSYSPEPSSPTGAADAPSSPVGGSGGIVASRGGKRGARRMGVPSAAGYIHLVTWLAPWPFETDALVAASGSAAAQKEKMEKFNPISPIFSDSESSGNALVAAIGGGGGGNLSVASEYQHRNKVYRQQQQVLEQLQQQQEEEDEEEAEREASQLAGALSAKHQGREETQERDLNNNNKQDENENSKNNNNSTNVVKPKEVLFEGNNNSQSKNSSSPRRPHPPGNKKNQQQQHQVSHAPSFLPRAFKVNAIPTVLPSLLTITSARNPSGIHQGVNANNNKEEAAGGDVDWSAETEQNKNAVTSGSGSGGDPNNNSSSLPHSGRNNNNNNNTQNQHEKSMSARQAEIDQHLLESTTSARMRNKARNFAAGTSAGILVPAGLQVNHNFPKTRDFKKIQNTTDRLQSELEHFRMMRKIRGGNANATNMELKEKLAGDDVGRNPRTEARRDASDWKNNTNNSSRYSSRSGNQGGSAATGRPKTPPKSFLAQHGMRAGEAVPHSPALPLPPNHHGGASAGSAFNATQTSRNSQGGGSSVPQLTVVTHPPVPWSRSVGAMGSVTSRFGHNKYTEPDNTTVVKALLD